jgi:hypothetical protein
VRVQPVPLRNAWGQGHLRSTVSWEELRGLGGTAAVTKSLVTTGAHPLG